MCISTNGELKIRPFPTLTAAPKGCCVGSRVPKFPPPLNFRAGSLISPSLPLSFPRNSVGWNSLTSDYHLLSLFLRGRRLTHAWERTHWVNIWLGASAPPQSIPNSSTGKLTEGKTDIPPILVHSSSLAHWTSTPKGFNNHWAKFLNKLKEYAQWSTRQETGSRKEGKLLGKSFALTLRVLCSV